MDKKLKILLSAGALVVLVATFWAITKNITELTGRVIDEPGNSDDFAECLASKGVKMYGAYWCGHCQNQKDDFGSSELFINSIYVECDPRGENPQSDLCLDKGIRGYPTWEINGKFYEGEQSFERLSELSGCNLN